MVLLGSSGENIAPVLVEVKAHHVITKVRSADLLRALAPRPSASDIRLWHMVLLGRGIILPITIGITTDINPTRSRSGPPVMTRN